MVSKKSVCLFGGVYGVVLWEVITLERSPGGE